MGGFEGRGSSVVEVASGGQGTGWGVEDLPCSSTWPEADHFPLQLLPPENISSSINNLPQELALRRVLHARYKSGPAELV